MSKRKYVVFTKGSTEEIIVFPKTIQHSEMSDFVRNASFNSMFPIAGGFVSGGECHGESISLRMKSRGDVDTALLKQLLC